MIWPMSPTTTPSFPIPRKRDGFLNWQKGRKPQRRPGRTAVFNRLLYLTTYTYTQSADPCSIEGSSNLYLVEFQSGGGAFNVFDLSALSGTPSARSTVIGSGTPSAPVITVNMKGIASVTVATMSGKINTRTIFSPRNKSTLYWREVIP